jgi:hypothetical protein
MKAAMNSWVGSIPAKLFGGSVAKTAGTKIGEQQFEAALMETDA